MIKKINDIKINYQQFGTGKDLVFLHGWGQNIEMMLPLANRFKDKYRITILDFPGFGHSEEPTTAYTIYDYSNLLEILLTSLGVKNPTLIGHSFGGRVAICYYLEVHVSEKRLNLKKQIYIKQ